MNNAVCGKTMENLRNRIDVRRASYKKNYSKWTSKPSYVSQKIFDNDLVAIRKSKVTLIFLDNTKRKIAWKKITTFFK